MRTLGPLLVPTFVLLTGCDDPPAPEASAECGHVPPIDCPLHAAGGEAAGHTAHGLLGAQGTHGGGGHHRPFADTADYIAHLERDDRAEWQKPDAVVAALGLSGDETVADVGAGSGYFSFRFARALPEGQVLAIDIEPEMIAHVKERAAEAGVKNVTPVTSTPDGPGIPEPVDLVFICDVLHHVEPRAPWLAKLRDQLKPGGRLVVIEFRMGELPVGPPESMRIPKAQIVREVTAAGFELAGEEGELLPYQELLIFTRPG